MKDGEFSNGLNWVFRATAVVTVGGIVWGMFSKFDRTLSGAVDAVGSGLLVGAAAYMIFVLIWFVLGVAFVAASNQENPFMQGLVFAVFGLIMLFFLDGALAGGHLLWGPAFSLVTNGDWEETFWGCRDYWVTADEGEFCGRGR